MRISFAAAHAGMGLLLFCLTACEKASGEQSDDAHVSPVEAAAAAMVGHWKVLEVRPFEPTDEWSPPTPPPTPATVLDVRLRMLDAILDFYADDTCRMQLTSLYSKGDQAIFGRTTEADGEKKYQEADRKVTQMAWGFWSPAFGGRTEWPAQAAYTANIRTLIQGAVYGFPILSSPTAPEQLVWARIGQRGNRIILLFSGAVRSVWEKEGPPQGEPLGKYATDDDGNPVDLVAALAHSTRENKKKYYVACAHLLQVQYTGEDFDRENPVTPEVDQKIVPDSSGVPTSTNSVSPSSVPDVLQNQSHVPAAPATASPVTNDPSAPPAPQGPPWIGLHANNTPAGITVTSLDEGSPAEGKLYPGDVILALFTSQGMYTGPDFQQVQSHIQVLHPGNRIVLMVKRGQGLRLRIPIVLGVQPTSQP